MLFLFSRSFFRQLLVILINCQNQEMEKFLEGLYFLLKKQQHLGLYGKLLRRSIFLLIMSWLMFAKRNYTIAFIPTHLRAISL